MVVSFHSFGHNHLEHHFWNCKYVVSQQHSSVNNRLHRTLKAFEVAAVASC